MREMRHLRYIAMIPSKTERLGPVGYVGQYVTVLYVNVRKIAVTWQPSIEERSS